MKTFLKAGLMVALLTGVMGLAVTPVNADALVPGATIPGPVLTLFFAGQTLVASTTGSFSTAAIAGNARTAVFSGGAGAVCPTCLTFYYQTENTGGGGSANDAITRTSFFSYDGGAITTSVFQITDGSSIAAAGGGAGFIDGTIVSLTADRSPDGSTVGRTFGTSATSLLVPGFTGLTFAVRTNATNFTIGNFAVIDGVAANVPTFVPVLVPEPASMLLLGTGLVGIAGAFRRRFNK